MILAIDPGNIESAYVIVTKELNKVFGCGKVNNQELLKIVESMEQAKNLLVRNDEPITEVSVAIEMIACYGQRVGREVFETCVMIGRIAQKCDELSIPYTYIFRKEEMKVLCEGQNNGDSGIRRALIERFARHDLKNGKGTKKNPDIFYGFSKDIWAAMAVAVTYHDLYLEKK